MSSFVDLLPQEMQATPAESRATVTWPDQPRERAIPWSLESFARDQIRGLVEQVFLASPTSPRQVVFSAVDGGFEIVTLCLQIAEVITRHTPGNVCVVDAVPRVPPGEVPDKQAVAPSCARRFGTLRDSAEQLSESLWFMRSDVFCTGDHPFSAIWLRARLAELRLEFDYTVLVSPEASQIEGAMLGSLADGLVLVLRANFTRRVTAQKVRETLCGANARLLGTVLTARTFPIPEALYKRL